jgi:hypothetical protein
LFSEPDQTQRWGVGDEAARPVWYRYIDGAITIYPTPDIANYPTMTIEYTKRESTLAQDTSRLQVDSTLVVTQAAADMKIHLGQPGAKELQAQAAYLLRSIKAQNAPGALISLHGYPRLAQYGTRYEPPSRQYNYTNADTSYEHQIVDQRGFLLGG